LALLVLLGAKGLAETAATKKERAVKNFIVACVVVLSRE
jgi:hypothetical protein